MSTPTENAAAAQKTGGQEVMVREDKKAISKNYKGFVAGVFSGIAKLSGGCERPLHINFHCA
jgi:hypothetical protein